ncbi:MAG: molybdopterin molybdenumtransferase MoeA [Gammaproteobacteria bacterium]|nr:MAG: molybdopterin molybdenumtransferase MoeA [Gammaproteobacteria bacterium]
MGCCDQAGLRPVGEAISLMLKTTHPVTETENVPLSTALDRILAETLVAQHPVPAYDNSAMDGYALRSQDGTDGTVLEVVGEALAGHPFSGELGPGQAVRIMTGAAMPDGADAVVMQERVERNGHTIRVVKWPRAGENVRRAGEDMAQGATVLTAGERLSPAKLGVVAAMGYGQVRVFRRLRVAVFSTGDELLPPGQPHVPGKIYESNTVVAVAMLRRAGFDVRDFGIVPDHPEAIAKTFREADAWADAVISSGGVSVGDADYTKDVLSELGYIEFWKLAIKPGKPFAFGRLNHSVFFGLPGNPVSAVVTLHQLALPVLRQMAGEQVPKPIVVQAQLSHDVRKKPGRREFQRAVISADDNGQLVVRNTGAQGSGLLTSIACANGYLTLDEQSAGAREGDGVPVMFFDAFIN